MDIAQLILDDHQEQRRLFSILEQLNRTDTKSLATMWKRLAAFLEVHAEAEEQIFYPALLRLGRRGRQIHRGRRDRGRDQRSQRDPRRGRSGRRSRCWERGLARGRF